MSPDRLGLVAVVAGEPAVSESHRRMLAWAISDMEEARLAAEVLLDDEETGPIWRAVLETAMAVSYMRPFTVGTLGTPLGERWLPEDEKGLRLHRVLHELRDGRYAHIDLAEGRGMRPLLDVGREWGDSSSLREGRRPLDREFLQGVVELCAAQWERFRQAVDDRGT